MFIFQRYSPEGNKILKCRTISKYFGMYPLELAKIYFPYKMDERICRWMDRQIDIQMVYIFSSFGFPCLLLRHYLDSSLSSGALALHPTHPPCCCTAPLGLDDYRLLID
jgi:hypothetical protein